MIDQNEADHCSPDDRASGLPYRRRRRRRLAVSPPCFFLLCSLVLLAMSIAWVEGTRADSRGHGTAAVAAAGDCTTPAPHEALAPAGMAPPAR